MPTPRDRSDPPVDAVTAIDLSGSPALTRGIARSLASKQEALTDEVNLIVDATYRVISRTGTIDPPLREILREAKLSTPAFYRHFSGKDELLAGLLQHGWLILGNYLSHQMERAPDGPSKIEAWIRGMLAQAADAEAARRSRPFVANLSRITTAFPEDHAASKNMLVELLVAPITSVRSCDPAEAWRDAHAIYELVAAVQGRHLIAETVPAEDEARHLVEFVLAAVHRPARRAGGGRGTRAAR